MRRRMRALWPPPYEMPASSWNSSRMRLGIAPSARSRALRCAADRFAGLQGFGGLAAGPECAAAAAAVSAARFAACSFAKDTPARGAGFEILSFRACTMVCKQTLHCY